MTKTFLRRLLASFLRVLAPWQLDAPVEGILRNGWVGVKTIAWHLKRGFGRIDRKLVASYLAGDGPKRLHLGCGEHPLPGWLNSDYLPTAGEIVHIDATRRFPLPDAAIAMIYSEHMIEHLEYVDAQFMLSECFRVLKPGGRLRVSTPDFQALIDLWRENRSELQIAFIDWSIESFIPWAPYSNEVFVANHFVRSWGHKFIFDKKSLREAIRRAGFPEIIECEQSVSQIADLCDLENYGRMPEGLLNMHSMTFEAIKAE